MNNVEIELISERYIGRAFQLTSIGVAMDYLSKEMQAKILDYLMEGKLVLKRDEISKLGNAIAYFIKSNKLCSKQYTSKLRLFYNNSTDREPLGMLGLIGRNINPCVQILNISTKLSHLDLNRSASPPMFIRTYVFSRFRGGEEASRDKISIGALWLALAGAIISLTARVHKKQNKQQKRIYEEIYIIPSGSLSNILFIGTLYRILHYESEDQRVRSFDYIVSELYSIDNLSFDIVLLLASLIKVSYAIDLAVPLSLSNLNLLNEFRATRIETTNRPFVLSEAGLKISRYLEALGTKGRETLRILFMLLRKSKNIRDSNVRKQLVNSVGKCFNSLFIYAETQDSTTLLDCTGDVCRLLMAKEVQESRIGNIINMFLSTIKRII